MVILNTPFAKVTYERENELVIINWMKNCTGDQYRLVFEKALRISPDFTKTRVISDISKRESSIPIEDRKWVEGNAIPRAISTRGRVVGLVVNEKQKNSYYTNIIFDCCKKRDTIIKVFGSITDARNWIISN